MLITLILDHILFVLLSIINKFKNTNRKKKRSTQERFFTD